MPSTSRRALLASASTALLALGGCSSPGSSAAPAHWVTVYLGEREETHDVSVAVTDADGNALFEREYRLSDANEADEHAPFPESTDPETVVVTVDGRRFERDWPGFEAPGLPCEGPNRSGVEVWVENGPDGDPSVRFEAGCQHVTTE
ncbi:MAG: hypothetical protein ABEJ89_07845 [Haloarculaceae archaeon]